MTKLLFPSLIIFFDYAICSHTLEDVRDPLFVCSELIRVAKRGYIEVPSRLVETIRGIESPSIAGLSHHRWLVEIQDNHMTFTMKYHMIHSDFLLSLPASYKKILSEEEKISFLFWENDFSFEEKQIHGTDNIKEELLTFVSSRHTYPQYMVLTRKAYLLLKRIEKKLNRTLSFNR